MPIHIEFKTTKEKVDDIIENINYHHLTICKEKTQNVGSPFKKLKETMPDIEKIENHNLNIYSQLSHSKPKKHPKYYDYYKSNESFLNQFDKESETRQYLIWRIIFDLINIKQLTIKMKNLSWSDIPMFFPELIHLLTNDILFAFVLKNADQLLKDISKIKLAVEFFPQYKSELFEHISKNPTNINSIGQMFLVTQIFPEPQFKDKLFEFVFNHTDLFFQSWVPIEQLMLFFPLPQYAERIRDFVLKNITRLLPNLTNIKHAIEFFPQHAHLFQNKSIIEIHAAVKEYLISKGNAEIRKNARVFAQQTRIPPELGIKIAAMTGTDTVQTEEQATKTAQTNYLRPS